MTLRGLCALCGGFVFVIFVAGCSNPSADERYFGKTEPPEGQEMRYVSGGEPESLDPQVGTGQPEARIYTALYEGLTEFDPQTGEAIPGLAERWEVNGFNSEFVFYLRRNARWSNGASITAEDFVYTVRRGLSPGFASRNAYLAYDILYAQAYNEGAAFVRDRNTGQFVSDPVDRSARLVVPNGSEALDPQLEATIKDKEIVPVRADDVGVDAIDSYTVRIRLRQSVPFLPGLLGHQFFRVVPRPAIERYGDSWTRPEHIVTSGPFVLLTWKPYDRLIVGRNHMYWGAANVWLDRIIFYPLEEATTMMNLYKTGEVDAVYNHVPPAAWIDRLIKLKDYMNRPENGNEFYYINVERPPTNDIRVRKALNMAIDKVALAEFKRVAQPLTGFVPEGIFPGYPHPKGDPFDPKRAQALLAEAGYRDADGRYDPSRFPVADVQINYNTTESNRQVAEFVQAQWKQNLGLTIVLKNMEFRTFLTVRAERDYGGVARSGWAGDYMDPFTFLDLFSTPTGNNGSGWFDPAYARLLREANRQPDRQKRYETLARAEAYMLAAQPMIPLYTPATNWMKKLYVKGMYPNPLTIHPWQFVYIEHDPAKWDQR
jgi:oligopeptide transport system substrate-binding protein